MTTSCKNFPSAKELKGEKLESICADISKVRSWIPVVNRGNNQFLKFSNDKRFTLKDISELIYLAAIQRQQAEVEGRLYPMSGKITKIVYAKAHSENSDELEAIARISDVFMYAEKLMGLEIRPTDKSSIIALASVVSGVVNSQYIAGKYVNYQVSNLLKINFKRRLSILETAKNHDLDVVGECSNLSDVSTFFKLSYDSFWLNRISQRFNLTGKKAVLKLESLNTAISKAMRKHENRIILVSYIDTLILVATLKWYKRENQASESPFELIQRWDEVIEIIVSEFSKLDKEESVPHAFFSRCVEPLDVFNPEKCKSMSLEIFKLTLDRLFNKPVKLMDRQLLTIYTTFKAKPMIKSRLYGSADFLAVVCYILSDANWLAKSGGLKPAMFTAFCESVQRQTLAATDNLAGGITRKNLKVNKS
jgi:hypothetical protein